jgi:hypothetical protein
MSEKINYGPPSAFIPVGISLRDYLALTAPVIEVEAAAGYSVRETSEFLGIPESEYDCRKHWILAVAKARYLWADAMLAARKEASK